MQMIQVFIALVEGDLNLTYSIFKMFENASGLVSNMSKCQIVLIRC
jgi:hypothetical protein